jgi:predicted transcriptional regulator/transcriptional regulator with XRE-family HTH domain
MPSTKTFIGPRLRQLRRSRKQTQAEMAKALGVSPSYVNLLENNQRSLSIPLLVRLSDTYGIEWRDLLDDDTSLLLADLRRAFGNPVFGDPKPDLQELRSALAHCPTLAASLLRLHESYETLMERFLAISDGDVGEAQNAAPASPESIVHDLFRRHDNHFPQLEESADAFRNGDKIETGELYSYLKQRLLHDRGIHVRTVPAAEMPYSLREYDEKRGLILLSEGLDYQNKVFQITHVAGLLEYGGIFDAILNAAGIHEAREQARCRIELANYFAAAVLMPYATFLAQARSSRYDLDYLASRFGVSFEQAGHRITTMRREGDRGVPFFFLRIDIAGNVTKRFNATSFHLAEHGGACPRWDIHQSFRTPGRVVPQFVELPDGSRYFTFSRTVRRPALGGPTQNVYLAVTLGCPIEYAQEVVYAVPFQLGDPGIVTPIGINCRLCPRQHCAQRAHQPLHLKFPIDSRRRGPTRFES